MAICVLPVPEIPVRMANRLACQSQDVVGDRFTREVEFASPQRLDQHLEVDGLGLRVLHAVFSRIGRPRARESPIVRLREIKPEDPAEVVHDG